MKQGLKGICARAFVIFLDIAANSFRILKIKKKRLGIIVKQI